MSPDHPNAILVRDAYTKWFAGIASPLMALLAQDTVYHLPGKHLGGGDLIGLSGIMRRGREVGGQYDGPPHSEIIDVVANDAFAITMERHRAKRRGAVLDQTVCGVWRLVDGQCVEMWTHFADQALVDAFWA